MQLITTTAVLSIQPSIFYQPMLILTQSQRWGGGLTQQCVGNRKEYTLVRSPVYQRTHTHTLTPRGTLVSPFSLLCSFLECGSKLCLGVEAPESKIKPRAFLLSYAWNATRQLRCSFTSYLSQKNVKFQIRFLCSEQNINMAAKRKGNQMYCNTTPSRRAVIFPP